MFGEKNSNITNYRSTRKKTVAIVLYTHFTQIPSIFHHRPPTVNEDIFPQSNKNEQQNKLNGYNNQQKIKIKKRFVTILWQNN